VSAWAAIAMESRTKARKVHSVKASWWVARSTVWPVTSAARGGDHHRGQHAGAGDLGEHRPPGRSRDAEVEPVDQGEVEEHVQDVAADRDVERGAGVLQAAQDAGGGEHDQQRGDAEQRDPQVRRGLLGDLGTCPEESDQLVGEGDADDGADRADDDREPEAVDPLGQGSPGVPGAEVACNAGRGPVGEEDAQSHDRLQDRRGDAEAGQRCGAEVPHDRGVGEQEERFGGQGEERGDGEAPDLAVLGAGHGPRLPTVRTSSGGWP
jgi:hypothetical protein